MAEERLATHRARFDVAVQAARDVLASVRDDDWARICAADGWPIALEGLHIGLGLRRQSGFLDAAFGGKTLPVFQWDETHELNAQIAQRRRPNPHFVLRYLEEQSDEMRRRLAAFTATDLDRPTVHYEGRVLNLDQFIRGFLIGHLEGHTQSIRSALAR